MPTTADPTGLDPALLAWLRPLLGEVALVRPLIGGITGQMLHVRRADGGPDVVVRRWSGDEDWRREMVRREADGLRALAGADLPLPSLVAADPDGTLSGRPTTVTTFLPGAVELDPPDLRAWVRELAAMLARIHAVPAPPLGPCELWASSDLGWLAPGDEAGESREAGEAEAAGAGKIEAGESEAADPGKIEAGDAKAAGLRRDAASVHAADAGLVRASLELAARAPDPARAVLCHGDYQHFNVLWQGGEISAVVDWPTVGLADRGLDVGHCRLNLAVLFSADAAMRFLDDYEQQSGVTVDPAPDLQRLLNFGPNWPEFIPLQVDGRAAVDGPGMAGRVRETIQRTLRRAG
ncbi:phosphotransferase family protein [Brachybacterium sp. AOP43-C2-M15]|uniref:phosphotransferase family protein n=1 Tax=Brachybacterium sp. AOP43-C2-M15 TaxID=3457661 RepID=UPI004034B066